MADIDVYRNRDLRETIWVFGNTGFKIIYKDNGEIYYELAGQRLHEKFMLIIYEKWLKEKENFL